MIGNVKYLDRQTSQHWDSTLGEVWYGFWKKMKEKIISFAEKAPRYTPEPALSLQPNM
jgi:hypothetical protein